jgi:hypothetical protein
MECGDLSIITGVRSRSSHCSISPLASQSSLMISMDFSRNIKNGQINLSKFGIRLLKDFILVLGDLEVTKPQSYVLFAQSQENSFIFS